MTGRAYGTIALFCAAACLGSATAQTEQPGQPAGSGQPAMPMQQMQMPGSAGPVTLPAQTVQEWENPTHRTGTDTPAPELLEEVAHRPALTLAQFEAWAAANPALAQARAEVQRSQGLARQAGLPPNPLVGYNGEHIRGGSYNDGEQGGFVQQKVLLGGKLGLRRDVYAHQASAGRVLSEEEQLRVQAEVDSAFYTALAAQQAVMLRREMMKLADDSVETTHQLGNVGQADSPDVLEAEVEREEARVAYEAAERHSLECFASLAALAARPEEPAAPLAEPDAAPELNEAEWVTRITTGSPAVRYAEQQVDAAEAKLKAERRESVPDLEVTAGTWWSGEQLPGTTKSAGWMGFAQAGVDLPLWNRNQGNKAAAQAAVAQAKAELEQVRISLRHDAETLAQQYRSARFAAGRYRAEMLPRAQRVHDLYLFKYQQMASPYLPVLTSQRRLLELQLAWVLAVRAERQAALRLTHYTPDLMPPTGNPALTMNSPE